MPSSHAVKRQLSNLKANKLEFYSNLIIKKCRIISSSHKWWKQYIELWLDEWRKQYNQVEKYTK